MNSGLPEKKRRLSLSLSNKSERFTVCLSEDLQRASKKAVPKNTTVAINWAFRLFEAWVSHSNELEGHCYSIENLWSHDDSEMLSLFNLEIKQQNGKPYTPKTVFKFWSIYKVMPVKRIRSAFILWTLKMDVLLKFILFSIICLVNKINNIIDHLFTTVCQ